MSSQRVSRGFHRLAVFLAAIPLLFAAWISINHANTKVDEQQKLLCAHQWVEKADKLASQPPGWSIKRTPSRTSIALSELMGGLPDEEKLSLEDIGCGSRGFDITLGEARKNPAVDSWATHFLDAASRVLSILFAISLALYGLLRAIGWVIGGFAAS